MAHDIQPLRLAYSLPGANSTLEIEKVRPRPDGISARCRAISCGPIGASRQTSHPRRNSLICADHRFGIRDWGAMAV